MLEILRRIVQEVNAAEDLVEASNIIVLRVKEALGVDACSVYQRLPEQTSLTLMASDGLRPESVGKLTLDTETTLTGLVAEKAEPINLPDASEHDRYRYYPETGEEKFHAFLGVPILLQRKILGVLVVQQVERRQFDEDHVAFLITLAAQLAGAISHVRAAGKLKEVTGISKRDVPISGLAGAPGIAIGRAVVAFPETDLASVPDRTVDDAKSEEALFRAAVEDVRHDLKKLKEQVSERISAEDSYLFDAYAMMLSSASLVDAVVAKIQDGLWAPAALRVVVEEHTRVFEEMDDPYMRERAVDIYDLGQRILNHLLMAPRAKAKYPKKTVLVGRDISASQLVEIPPDRLVALVSTTGSASSHVAILARALGIPTVMGARDLPLTQVEGKELVVNGYDGTLLVQPSATVRYEYMRLARQEAALAEDLREQAAGPAITLDGEEIPVLLNSGLMADMLHGQAEVAEGVGLYRTELPFMLRDRFPGESEQVTIYSQVMEAFEDKPVTLRTLDVGGDKALSYFPIVEDNPFLGLRGIRITLDHPEIFMTQLRAMLIANEHHGNLQILFPMIGSLEQLEEALMLLEHAKLELIRDGRAVPRVNVGVMVEVPSAVFIARDLAEQCDFLSIGSNDLIQYLLAVDRNNDTVARLYDDAHPAVLHAIKAVVTAAAEVGKPVSVCGEMASDPASAMLLLGAGVQSLSVSIASLPRIKWVIRSFSREHLSAVFREALALNESAAIRCLLDRELVDAGLGALVRAGR